MEVIRNREDLSSLSGRKALVTGGCGFLGRAIVRWLAANGAIVTACDVRVDPAQCTSAKYVVADISKKSDIINLCADAEIVFHTASLVDMWLDGTTMDKVNIFGTHNVVEACVQSPTTKYLIYTSTAVVVFNQGESISGGDETLPYAHSPMGHYGRTKIIAERMVLSSNGRKQQQQEKSFPLLTCALRPMSIIGKGCHLAQTYATPIDPNPSRLNDCAHVEDVAYAHMRAAVSLMSNGSKIGGQAYFTTGSKIQLGNLTSELRQHLGLRPHYPRVVPKPLVVLCMYMFEFLNFLIGHDLKWFKLPFLNKATFSLLYCDQTFRNDKALVELGWKPIVGFHEGIREMAEQIVEKKMRKIQR